MLFMARARLTDALACADGRLWDHRRPFA